MSFSNTRALMNSIFVVLLVYTLNMEFIMQATQTQIQHDPKRIAGAALQVFFNLSDQWGLQAREERVLLGDPAPSTFFAWKSNRSASKLSHDTLDRISYLMGIHKALNILLPSPRAADEWIKKPNNAPLFGGDTALNRMLGGKLTDLADVRRYLDAQRGL